MKSIGKLIAPIVAALCLAGGAFAGATTEGGGGVKTSGGCAWVEEPPAWAMVVVSLGKPPMLQRAWNVPEALVTALWWCRAAPSGPLDVEIWEDTQAARRGASIDGVLGQGREK